MEHCKLQAFHAAYELTSGGLRHGLSDGLRGLGGGARVGGGLGGGGAQRRRCVGLLSLRLSATAARTAAAAAVGFKKAQK